MESSGDLAEDPHQFVVEQFEYDSLEVALSPLKAEEHGPSIDSKQ